MIYRFLFQIYKIIKNKGTKIPAKVNHHPLPFNPYLPFRINKPEIVTKRIIMVKISLTHFQAFIIDALCK